MLQNLSLAIAVFEQWTVLPSQELLVVTQHRNLLLILACRRSSESVSLTINNRGLTPNVLTCQKNVEG